MRDKFFSLLGIEPGEESMVSILLTQSIFLGIFFGAFDISAHSLFLSTFDEKMMARGYVVSGVAGIILTSLYTWLQTRLKFRNFAIMNLMGVTLITLVLWLILTIAPSKWVIFFVFIMLGPLNILAGLGFWGTAGRLFTLRQGKRLFGLVDSGLVIGTIVSCYAIPVILSFGFESHNILLICASSVFIATVIQILIGSRFQLVAGGEDTANQKAEKPKAKGSVITVLKKDPYIRIMAVFIALSVVTAFFVQYSFMAVTREQYPAEEDMARFLGIFTGSMMIFTLLVKLLVFSYLIRNYGLRTCLTLSPMLILLFTALAVTVGMLLGYTPAASGGFLIFFLVLALSRLFSKSLKDSIESPSFKVIYQTIDEKIRYEVQSGMDGTINEIAALSSGLILSGLGVLSFVKLIHFSWVLFFIITLWIFVAFRLYKEYRRSIRKALETVDTPETVVPVLIGQGVFKSRFSVDTVFNADYFNLIAGDDSFMNRNNDVLYLNRIIDHCVSENDIRLVPALKKMASNINLDEQIRSRSAGVAQTVEKLFSSGSQKEKKTFHTNMILSGTRLPQTTGILRLLRDNSAESKRIGIFMIGKFKLSDMLPEVCQYLNVPGLEKDAFSVIKSFGKSAENELERFYLASSGNIYTSKAILRLLGNINTRESSSFLFSRLWSNSRTLKETTVKYLMECEFKPSKEDKDRLNQLISDIIGLMTWNLSARVCVEKYNDKSLLEILDKEINRWNRFLFNILSITYDAGSINKIRGNLENGTVASVNFALEMIDIVIDDSIKPKLTSLLDLVSDEEKLKSLFHFFPGKIPSYGQVLEDIINRDYNLLSIWTKAFTLRHLREIVDDNMAESVVALLFSPEAIMQEESAKLIIRSKKEKYRSVFSRVPSASLKRLEKIINGEVDEKELLFEKVKFLSACFSVIPEEELISLAEVVRFMNDSKQDGCLLPENYIVWFLSDDNQVMETHVVYEGDTGNTGEKNKGRKKHQCYILPLNAIEEHNYQYPDNAFEMLKCINSFEE
ncbi:MAG TPA: hypothetical protein PLR88_01000 [Bacteroidales bacterium]|nr:hypothetical protein [Bacteroidales bacterium]HPT20495.1 hypothetical protein [Bacteroidales bacterium]